MTLHSMTDPTSILEGGKLKPGIYKIQNIQSETYVDIEVHTREVCGRPANDLGEGRGFKWEIKSLGAGYTVQFVEPGKPQQFCTPTIGIEDHPQLVVGGYPIPWRVEVVHDARHRGFEYVRLFWGATDYIWNLRRGDKENGTRVTLVAQDDKRLPQRIWKLIPVKVEGAFPPSQSLSEVLCSGHPFHDGDSTARSSFHTQVAESEHDDFGTVTEVTTVTTTTRRRYRVEDA